MIKYVAKEDVINYPLINFKGNIHVVSKLSDLIKYCDILSKKNIVGFDTETKPAFKKGVSYNISVLQLSADNDIFIFRIDKTGLNSKIIDVLSDPDILKVGIDIKNDLIGLKKITQFKESNFLDLNVLAVQKGFKSIGAVKLCIMLLGYRISKSQRLTDWSADNLTAAQLQYAAIDAWICPMILAAFKRNLLYP